ncbi:hypothetical protein [Pollutibacter soli]
MGENSSKKNEDGRRVSQQPEEQAYQKSEAKKITGSSSKSKSKPTK